MGGGSFFPCLLSVLIVPTSAGCDACVVGVSPGLFTGENDTKSPQMLLMSSDFGENKGIKEFQHSAAEGLCL